MELKAIKLWGEEDPFVSDINVKDSFVNTDSEECPISYSIVKNDESPL